MKIAIHNSKWSFCCRWVDYCEERGIGYKLVNCYDSNIIDQLKNCDALMWHHHQSLIKDVLFAKQLLFALETAGITVFPDFRTGWHFDDKLGQKYLLEAVGAPLVPTHVFYEEKDAREWISKTSFPKIFKLRTGAGSNNVFLAPSRHDALAKVKQAFGKGFSQYRRWRDLQDSFERYRSRHSSLMGILKSLKRMICSTSYAKFKGNEKGYVYFQDFIPDNDHDVRIIVVGSRAFGIKRLVRKNDFRASGSGLISYKREDLAENCVRIAFDVSRKIGSQCAAYDFVFDEKNGPLITEINYGFAKEVYDPCGGYWDGGMNWHEGKFNPYGWMVEDLISQINKRRLETST